MGCSGAFTGTYFQLVNNQGARSGKPWKEMDVYVAGDLVTLKNGTICWSYVNREWQQTSDLGHDDEEDEFCLHEPGLME